MILRLKHVLALLFVATLSTVSAQANDSASVGVGGRWKMLKKEHPSIQMVRETVNITVHGDRTYTTVADFTFHNRGSSTKVQMGFPEGGGGDVSGDYYKSKSSFKSFESWVDGRKVPVKRRFLASGEESFEALWVKTVTFRAGQTRYVRVRYRSYVGSMAPSTSLVEYDFTGGNWWGLVQSTELNIRFQAPGAYTVNVYELPEKARTQHRGNVFTYTWKNWQAQDFFQIAFDTTLPGSLWQNARSPDSHQIYFEVNSSSSLLSHPVNYLPPAVLRQGHVYIALTDWLSWAQDKNKVTGSFDERGRAALIRKGARVIRFPLKARDGTFTAWNSNGQPTLFVPESRLEKELGARFKFDLKAHHVVFLA